MKRYNCILLIMLIGFYSGYTQQIGTSEFVFGWRPSPTQFIRDNYSRYLTNNEYRQVVACDVLAFDAIVDLDSSRIISVEYSNLAKDINAMSNGSILDTEIANKVSVILLKHITLSKVKSIGKSKPPYGHRVYLIVLSFNDKDRRRASKLK